MQSKSSTVAEFESWMRFVGIKWNSEAITITDTTSTASTLLCGGLALGITAARDIKEGDELCRLLPKSACICPLTCSIADILEKEELNSGLGLVVAVMHESSLGTDSKWAGYFEAMPHREYLPVFWTKQELTALQGTEIENSSSEDLANVEDDYITHVLPLLTTYKDRFRVDKCTLHHFHSAASLVASRMFGIDEIHGAGMVPLADAFNHKASVVDLAPEYAVHGADSDTESDVEGNSDGGGDEERNGEENGKGEKSSEDGGSGEEEEAGNDDAYLHRDHDTYPNEGSALPTVLRRGNPTDDMTATKANHPALHGITKANGLHLALEIAIIDGGDHLSIVAASDIPATKEVHNTYGELGNDILVKKYGFALRYNPFNAVQLKKSDVVNACKELYDNGENAGDCDNSEEEIGEQASEPAKKKTKRGGGGSKGNGHSATNKSESEKTFNSLVKILENETDLLTEDDDEEPFELHPNGHIGPALFATLRVLCSGAESLKHAAMSLDDALRATIPSDENEEAPVFLDPGNIKAVQIFPVTNEEGKLLSENELGAAAAAAAKKVKETKNNSSDVLNSDGDASSTTSSMVTSAMCTALLAAVQRRMQRYPTRLDETIVQLEKFENELLNGGDKAKDITSSAALSEGQTATRAALTLRLTEQEILKGIEIAARMKCLME
ncbi:hypothetical protein Ndes2526B_g07697 [Nannochloris sp. 'desiccata']|nr:hypothetical protein KSW81_002369 [Chlorella desiccata (nom. nud.)]